MNEEIVKLVNMFISQREKPKTKLLYLLPTVTGELPHHPQQQQQQLQLQ